MEQIPWSMDWINYIKLGKDGLEPYPLQFANCRRIEKEENKAIYIFDEVGTGKTISSGLMALHYLHNHPGKSVLVITVNALVKPSFNAPDGQFFNDWLSKLPFEALGLANRITVINDHYSNIKKYRGSWGLIIIDEAHRFLNDDTQRHTALLGLSAEKVVFLTATPIKTGSDDLDTYVEIARAITEPPSLSDSWKKEILTGERTKKEETTETKTKPDITPEQLICSKFDPEYPVTRYFKDTVRALQVGSTEKVGPRRLLAKTWEYTDEEDKKQILLKCIQEEYDKDTARNRFVVFVRLVEKEAENLEKFFTDNGYEKWKGRLKDCSDQKTVKVVTGTGGNSSELGNFASKNPDDLPTVLILTYQIAEQGVNLPGFNHVVNYHIPAYPSSLEQRYGRVDRMNSDSLSVSIHFLIRREGCGWDTNTANFNWAIWLYIQNFLSCLPCKNAILNKDILDGYVSREENIQEYVNRIKGCADQDDTLRQIIAYAAEQREERKLDAEEPKEERTLDADAEELAKFIEGEEIELDLSGTEDAVQKLRNAIQAKLGKYTQRKKLSEDDVKGMKAFFARVTSETSDKIFYLKSDVLKYKPLTEVVEKALDTVDAIGGDDKTGCAALIAENGQYKEFKKDFHKRIMPAIRAANYVACFDKYQDELEEIYERLFLANRLEEIFIAASSESIHPNGQRAKEYCEQAIRKKSPDKAPTVDEIQTLYLGFVKCWRQLPFFQMCDAFSEILREHCLSDGYVKRKFDKNQFIDAFCELAYGVYTARQKFFFQWTKDEKLWVGKYAWWARRLSDDFYEHLETAWHDICKKEEPKNPFRIENKDGKRLASNWLRLLVQLTSREWVTRANGEKVSVLDGFLYSASDRRMSEGLFPIVWWDCDPNLPKKSSEEDWWTNQMP